MRIKEILVIVLVIISNSIFGQQHVNEYKYVTVPKNYDFLTKEDQYQLNSLTKFLFDKEGFETLFDIDTKPQDLINNGCLNLLVHVKSSSSMISTKLTVELINCRNKIVYSGVGKSKSKEYKQAYHEAVRKALEPLKKLNYKFNPELIMIPIPVKEEIKEEPVIIEKEPIVEVAENKPVEQEVEEVDEEAIVEPITVKENRKIDAPDSNILYAQKTTLGYQLVDSAPKVVYILQKSSSIDVYILKNKNGIVFKNNDKWIAEYYENDQLIQKELSIKF